MYLRESGGTVNRFRVLGSMIPTSDPSDPDKFDWQLRGENGLGGYMTEMRGDEAQFTKYT